MAHFYGAPPMALLTVGAGTLLLGKDLLGTPLAVGIDWVLWTVGTILGLGTACVVPYLSVTRLAGAPGDPGAFGGWLMPVVPPMVSAATGALLLPHLPTGPARLALLLACYAFFGLSLIASLVVITLICVRLAGHGVGPAVLTPTLFIVLGPVGQSVTAANLLGGNAHLAVAAPYSTALQVFGVAYGVPAMGFAALWAVRAGARHDKDRPDPAALRTDLVVVHLPHRDLCHRADRAGCPHRLGRRIGRCGRGVRRIARRLGDGGDAHAAGRPVRRPPGAEAVDIAA